MNDLGDGDGQTVHEGLDGNLHFAEQGDVSIARQVCCGPFEPSYIILEKTDFLPKKHNMRFGPRALRRKSLLSEMFLKGPNGPKRVS